MNNIRLKLVTFFLLATAVIGFLWIIQDNPGNTDFQVPNAKSAIGTSDTPLARAEYEWLRFRDPKTGRIPRNIRTKELEFARELPVKKDIGNNKEQTLNAFSWEQRGPVNVGGRTRALAIDVTDENVLLAGGASGGMWRSTDGGSNWTKTTAPQQLHTITALAQDVRPGKTNIWYAGSGEVLGSASGIFRGHAGIFFNGDGVFKSTDGGQTWTELAATSTGTPHAFDSQFDFVTNIATDPSDLVQDVVYASTFGGISRSTDGGTSWNIVLGSLGNNSSVWTDVTISQTGTLYATLSQLALQGNSAEQGIYRSTDGTTWTDITPPGWPTTFRRVVAGIAPSNENVVYFAAHTPGFGLNDHSFWKYTYLSGDGSGAGGQWEDRSANLPAEGDPVGDFDSQFGYDLLVKVRPDDENMVFIGGTNLYRSSNGFATANSYAWIGGYSPVNNISQISNQHPDQHALVFLPSDPNTIYSGHDGGLSKTTNSTAQNVFWSNLNKGYFTTQFYTVAIDQVTPGSNKIVGGMQDNSTYFTGSAFTLVPWVQLTGGDGSYCAIQEGGNVIFTSFQEGTTFKLQVGNDGTVSAGVRVDPVGGANYLFVNPFILDPNDENIMYLAGGDRIWRNSDLSAIPFTGSSDPTSINWTQLTNSAVAGQAISALAVSTAPANTLYYGTTQGQAYRLDNANTGDPARVDVWTGKGFPSNGFIHCIAVDPTDDDHAIVVFSNYDVQSIFYTTDRGATWTPVGGNLEQTSDGTGNGPAVLWVEIVYVNDVEHYFAGTSVGLYSTAALNGAFTIWEQEGANEIGNVIVDMIDSRSADGVVVAATHGNGVFSTQAVTSIAEQEQQIPEVFSLSQNFPNPFNPTTTIQFSLPRETPASIKVYNIYGQEIATLLDAVTARGMHKIEWDGTDWKGRSVASGIYYYKLTAGSLHETRKMTLLK